MKKRKKKKCHLNIAQHRGIQVQLGLEKSYHRVYVRNLKVWVLVLVLHMDSFLLSFLIEKMEKGVGACSHNFEKHTYLGVLAPLY